MRTGENNLTERDALLERAARVSTEVDAATELFAARAPDWTSTVQALHSMAYSSSFGPEDQVVDIKLLGLYRELFNKLGALVMMADPYCIDLRGSH